MAKHDRCTICDYSEANGSSIAGVSPGVHGKVRRYGNDLRCDTCSDAIARASIDLRPPTEIDEDLVLLEE